MQRTVLIGLDGATFTVLDHLMAAGVMPFLKQFVERGVRANLLSTAHPLTPPAWTSLATGRTPGHHGIFDFIRAEESPEGLYFTLNTSDDIRCETIWSMVSRQGGTVAALNYPVSYPPFQVKGYMVPGMVSWKHLRRAVHPAGFYDEMKAIPGFDAKVLSLDVNQEFKAIQWLPREEYEDWLLLHIRREQQWFGLVRTIMEKHPTDLVAIVFDGVDKLQHLCWRFLDPDLAPQLSSAWEDKIRERCLEYFRLLDGFIRDIVGLAGPDARIFMASDHGFGPTKDVFYANVWLEREGYLSWADQSSKDEVGKLGSESLKNHVVGINWTKTVAHALSPSSNGIFIRQAEKPGQAGIPRAEYAAFRSRLAAKLAAVTHPETGKPLVKRVMTREEAFPGNESRRAPDLTLVLEDHSFISVLNADAPIKSRTEVAGTHRPEGVFMAAGAGIVSGRALGAAPIIDVTPTLLYSLGLAVPSDLEGRVLAECFDPSYTAGHPVVVGAPTTGPADKQGATASAALPDEDQDKVIDRLKALGYIE